MPTKRKAAPKVVLTVAQLLEASWAAHKAAQQVTTGAKDKRRVTRGLDVKKLTEAYELRKQAIATDPDHTDPAWQQEQARTPNGRDTHAELMAYYRGKLDV